MRDIKRISDILKEFELLWQEYPDLRFFQLISMIQKRLPGNFKEDPFYYEDDELEDFIFRMRSDT